MEQMGLSCHNLVPIIQEKKLLFFLRVNLYTLDIYAYDSGLQKGGYILLSRNRPGIAFLCHATGQDSLAVQSSSDACEMGPLVL